MPKESCIEHPRGLPFIVIKQSYVNLFSGDHSLAALLYCLEHFTNVEIEHLDSIERSGDEPWFEAPGPMIVSQMTGLYSERTVRTGVGILSRLDLVKVNHEGNGKRNKYLLNVDRVNELVRKRHRFETEEISACKIAPEEISESGAMADATADAISTENGRCYISEDKSEVRQENTPYIPHSEYTLATFQDFLLLWSKTRGLKRLSAGERAKAQERWGSAQIGVDDLRTALERFAGWLKTSDGIRSPLMVFLRDPNSWATLRTVEKDEVSRPQMAGHASAETVQSFVALCEPRFRHYIGVFLVAGKEITLPRVKMAYAKWQGLTEDQREGAISHAERNFPERKTEFIPSPERHIDSQPWTAIQMPRALPQAKPEKLDPNAEARRLLREEAKRNGGYIRL